MCLLAFLLIIIVIYNSNNVFGQVIVVYNCTDLQGINGNLTLNYTIFSDLDCSETVNWNGGSGFLPIGTASKPFTGSLFGGNFTIYNLTINLPTTTNYVGLFGYINGANISQIVLKNVNVQGGSYVGGLIGFISKDISVSQIYSVSGNVSGSTYVGGIVGYISSISTTVCSYCFSVSGNVSGSTNIGGIVGYGNVLNSFASCNVFGFSTVGGLVGTGSASYSHASGNVIGSTIVGGLVGESAYPAITNCYATGSVTGLSNVGGFVGQHESQITNCYSTGSVTGSSYVGGFAGFNYGFLTNVYSSGFVSGITELGGLIGGSGGCAFSSYWNTQSSGQLTSAGGLGKNTSQFSQSSTFLGWNFTCIWALNSAPLLTLNNNCASLSSSSSTLTPVQVNNCQDLQQAVFMNNVDVTLMQDIDCTETLNWNGGAGFTSGYFSSGIFNGGGHQISNLYINQPLSSCLGVFGQTGSQTQITNLNINQVNIIGNSYVGSLVGYSEQGIIYLVTSSGNISATGGNVGGLIGYSTGSILQSSSSATVTVNGTATYVGGLIGQSTILTSCFATGNVYASQSTAVGGLAGICQTISSSYSTGNVFGTGNVGGLAGVGFIITNCYAKGNVFASGSYTGGLIGYCYTSISNCFSNGNVLGSTSVGGLLGSGSDSITVENCFATGNVFGLNAVGGLIGLETYQSVTTYCYSTGSVSGTTNVGGLIGIGAYGVTFSFWDIQTSLQTFSSAGVGFPTAVMKQISSFAGWDFVSTWVMNQGITYPLLQAFVAPPIMATTLVNVTEYIGSQFVSPIPSNTYIDPQNLSLAYSVVILGGFPLPSWLFFTPSTQNLAGLPLSGSQGKYVIQITVSNLPSQSISSVWQLTIPDRPPFVNAPFIHQIALNSQPFQFIIPGSTFIDPDGDHLQLTAFLINNSALPPWLSFNSALGIFSGVVTKRGTVSINVTANDGYGGEISAILNITTPDTAPQTTGTFPNQVLIINDSFNLTLPSSLFFDLDGDSLLYHATLFGGGPLFSWMIFDAQTLTFQGTPTSIGFLMVSVIATDPFNETATLNFGISVVDLSSNSPPLLSLQTLSQSATVNQQFIFILPNNTFIDPNGNSLTYSATLEGGAPLPSWLTFDSILLSFSGTPKVAGTIFVTVKANNGLGGFALDSFAITIASSTNLPPFLENPISNQVVSVGENYEFTIPSNTFIDLNNAPLIYSASTAHNRSLPSWLHFDSSSRTFTGTPSDKNTKLYRNHVYHIEVKANNGIGTAFNNFQIAVSGKSQTEILINAVITIASVCSTLFAIYRNRASLWNLLCKRIYEKKRKEISPNQSFTHNFSVDHDKIMSVKAFHMIHNFSSPSSTTRFFQMNKYRRLPDEISLPDWLQFNRKTGALSGTAPTNSDSNDSSLYIVAIGYDDRYLEAFELIVAQHQSKQSEGVYNQKDLEMLQM